MCGIAGWFSTHGRTLPDDQRTAVMLHQLAHRGPDGTGISSGDGVSLGMNRLAIVGQAANLPFTNHSGSIVVALNGEIYNWRTLARDVLGQRFMSVDSSDGTVLPYLFEALGEAMFEKLVGMFALAVWDKSTGTLYLVRDRLGIKPLFWWPQGDIMAFASELGAFRAWPAFPPPLAEEQIASYLQFRFVPHPHTLLRNVWKVSPGTAVRFRRGQSQPTMLRYWALGDEQPVPPRSQAEAVEQLDDLLRQVVRDHQAPEGMAATFLLSGGVDSSLLTTIAVREAAAFGRAFTLDDLQDPLERENARQIAQLLALPMVAVPGDDPSVTRLIEVLHALDEPLGDPTAISLGTVLQHARSNGRLVYSGEGADEVFLGYSVYRRARWHRATRAFGESWRPWAQLSRPLRDTYRGVGGTFQSDDLELILAPEILALSRAPNLQLPSNVSGIRTLQAIDLLYSLPDDVLTKADRLTMAGQMELRVPFLDHRLVEWAWAVDDQWLGTNGNKPLLRRVAARVIPRNVAYREKTGFPTPLSRWLNGPWREWVDDMTTGPVAQSGLWNREGVQSLRQRVNPGGVHPAGRQLFAILALQAWFDRLGAEAHHGEERAHVNGRQL